MFVEARTPGGDDWTTLPDANGHTTTSTGRRAAPAGWRVDLHPQLDALPDVETADGDCTPTGTTGVWNAASGNSGGWQQWRSTSTPTPGETVEISIAYVSDWAVQNLGVFLDDVTLPDGTSTSFEADLGGWTVTGPPEGSGPNANNWIRTDASGFPVGATISTPDSLLIGFGFEGISTQASRNAVMGRSLRLPARLTHLGPPLRRRPLIAGPRRLLGRSASWPPGAALASSRPSAPGGHAAARPRQFPVVLACALWQAS